MKREDIKIGTFVWWSRIGTSTNQNVSCPGIISKVSKTGFHVVTFDDMKEIEKEIPFSSEIVTDEFVWISRERALAFHQKKMNNLRELKVKLEKELREAEDTLTEHSRKSESHWRSQPLFPFLQGFETA